MTTRLDRLFLLLDTGSTPLARKAAAQQLGEVQKLHPHELHNLLARIHNYLKSSSWETRIAAGQAVEAVCSNVPQWLPKPIVKQESISNGEGAEKNTSTSSAGQLTFENFDLMTVLEKCASLLGSEGIEYNNEHELSGLDQKEKLAKQRQLLNKRLGLDVMAPLGLQSNNLFTDEDLENQSHISETIENVSSKESVQLTELVPSMSSREKNLAKRKAKQLARHRSRDVSQDFGSQDVKHPPKKRKTANVIVEQGGEGEKLVIDSITDSFKIWEENDQWPFELFCENLAQDLFNPKWEIRHGAGVGLREVLCKHGGGAGVHVSSTSQEQRLANQQWLDDIVLRTLCVLALDRFGDFVSDEVVAPVRETCAQVIGVILSHCDSHSAMEVTRLLVKLLKHDQWETRHGALLGMKYLLAVKKELMNELLPEVFSSIFAGLQDACDDVCAVAAASLAPVANDIISILPNQVTPLITHLWDSLLDLDDLTASTNSIMMLLASLLANSHVSYTHSDIGLENLVPRLLPFFDHTISSVRKSALLTVNTLVNIENLHCPVSGWLPVVIQDALRRLFQRGVIEREPDILDIVYKVWCTVLQRAPLEAVITTTCPWLNVWLYLMMQPAGVPIDSGLLVLSKPHSQERSGKGKSVQTEIDDREYIGGRAVITGSAGERDAAIIRARCMAAKCLGVLCSYIAQPSSNIPFGTEMPLEALCRLLLFHLSTKSAVQRLTASLLILEWARIAREATMNCLNAVKSKLLESLNEPIYFDEIAINFTQMQTDCKDLIVTLKKHGVDLNSTYSGNIITIDDALELSSTVCDTVIGQLSGSVKTQIETKRRVLSITANLTQKEQQNLSIRVQALQAGALIALQCLPDKLNPVIRPVMDSLKKEENRQLQKLSASVLAEVVDQCDNRQPSPNAKIIKNICTMLCSDPSCTPLIRISPYEANTVESSESKACAQSLCDTHHGIFTLVKQQMMCDRPAKRGRRAGSVQVEPSPSTSEDSTDDIQKPLMLQRRGAEFALLALAQHFGADLFNRLPTLWETISLIETAASAKNSTVNNTSGEDEVAQELVNSLQLLEVITPAVHSDLKSKIMALTVHLCHKLKHGYAAVRHMASRCFGVLARYCGVTAMTTFLQQVLPLLAEVNNDICSQQGAIEAVANITEQLELDVVPFIVLMIVPVLGCMSSQNEAVRLMANQSFASLLRIMPLESGSVDVPDLDESLVQEKAKQRVFLDQLLNSGKAEDFKVLVPIKAELRKYQKEGVNWLAFLNKYKLHGILCDDMGLGKTLQSLCILASDHYANELASKENSGSYVYPLLSIVVCPPTLTGHWVYEVQKFVGKRYLNPLHYTGPPAERERLKLKVKDHNLVIASYDIVRNDIDFFSTIKWNYCILDEGHIIKNTKTKISRAVKQLQASHRLILSGTPIQNNVLELWSLFDFLLPGFLGTERQFATRYGRPILASRDAKSSTKEQEAGAVAMEALHRQVLPFLLRRLKEDVLQDLPPKIMQDYYCELSPLQMQLYEDFAKSKTRKELEESQDTSEKPKLHSHVFQALQYLRKVCNHPLLVVNHDHPMCQEITRHLQQTGSTLSDIQHAAKLPALKQLLQDCGIGVTGNQSEVIVSQHRALVFCQLKSMLDIVEKQLFQANMPSVTYLRLDGSIPAGSRHSIVNRFNNDPSIDVLLLTTHVGGLGLNLTGADTVIFVEHDWNPMKDLQAMDRAHRIGQKKVVNVYRLITRGTLEEKIMSLQRFKMNIANTVISQDNSSLLSMATDKLFDLFSLDTGWDSRKTEQDKERSEQTKQTMSQVLEDLGQLWDEKQYEEEYDLSTFMEMLKK